MSRLGRVEGGREGGEVMMMVIMGRICLYIDTLSSHTETRGYCHVRKTINGNYYKFETIKKSIKTTKRNYLIFSEIKQRNEKSYFFLSI